MAPDTGTTASNLRKARTWIHSFALFLDIATCKTMYCGYSRHVQANRGDGPHDVATITMSVDNIRLCRQTERSQDAPFTHIKFLAPTRTTALSTPSPASLFSRNGWSSLSSWPIAAATVTRCPAACCERARRGWTTLSSPPARAGDVIWRIRSELDRMLRYRRRWSIRPLPGDLSGRTASAACKRQRCLKNHVRTAIYKQCPLFQGHFLGP